jgi:hypothetical protein
MNRRLPFAMVVICGLACSSSAPSSSSVLERNNHPSRDGHFVQPALTKAAAAKMALDTGFQATFTGAMWASPLYLENGPGGRGVFFAVTTGNDVFALDETTGAVRWTHNIGSSPAGTGAGCGDINPVGILSTPVIDAAARTIYVAGAIGTTAIARDEIHALSVDDGSERPGWPIDVTNTTAPGPVNQPIITFAVPYQNQRSALSLVRGILYVAFGGHVGDCGPYHGFVIAVDTKTPTQRGAWATSGQAEGIWAAGGMASDGTSVFATTGNSIPLTAGHLDSEEVVRVTGLAAVDKTSANNYFFPASWYDMDTNDADLSANNPLYLPVPGATPLNYVMSLSKDGHMYLLDGAHLGAMAGQVVDFMVSTGNSIHTAPTAYTSGQLVHVAFPIESNPLCPTGSAAGTRVVMSVAIPAGAPPKPQIVWCAPIGGGAGPPAPISTTTDGKSQALVWFMNGDQLNAVDGDTGAVIFGGGAGSCAGVRQWTSPIAVKGRVVVGADGHLCSWSPH